jgi:tRNA (cmo5U34)-methyltransferase
MTEDWNDREFALQWDQHVSTGHPNRTEQLDILASVLKDNYVPGDTILDIGCGSGQVEELLFAQRSDFQIVGVDSSKPMIDIAKQRLQQFGDRIQIVRKDISDLQFPNLPVKHYQFAISVQVLHELTNADRQRLFQTIFKFLVPGGSFFIFDRIKIDMDTFNQSYGSLWKRLEGIGTFKSAATYADYREEIYKKTDFPGTLNEYMASLKDAGFLPAILDVHFDRALVVGVKPQTLPS